MELDRIVRVLVAAFLVCRTGAFLPSHVGQTLPVTDYTLTELTTEGIVRAVAMYFEDSDPDRYTPGDLTGLTPLTPSRLFQAHYGDCVYSTKFEAAISAILDENIRISETYAHKAVWHFNGNQINKGNRKMVGIRDTLLDLLSVGDENAPDYDVARVHCGQFLHMAHSFYSNTNWIELNRWLNSLMGEDKNEIITSSELGIIAPLAWLQSPGSVDMCQNCPGSNTLPELQDCTDNLRPYVYYLTSGYRSGQDKAKPAADPGGTWGKCSHGGINDDSWTAVATGGINKETSDQRLSPHYSLHQQAALTALQATEDFFYHPDTGLYKLIGEQKFRKLLNLDVGTSLTFVIDTTGSMSQEIEAVKEEMIELVSKHSETCLAASKYVVAPFNDPDVGPVHVTADPQESIYFIGNLSVDGGDDCPEMANSGMELGIQHSVERTNVYVITDASDKDKDKLPDVLALIDEKNVRVKFLLTGTCAGARRRKRATGWSPSPSYESIASSSGGQIYQTDNSGIRDLVGIIEGDIRASQVTITKGSSLNNGGLTVDIPVDSTTQEVLVTVVGTLDDDTVTVVNPEGLEGSPSSLGAGIFTDSTEQIVFSINASESASKGNWTLKLQDLDLTSEYKVTVSANSFLDFSFDILETDESGTAYPIDGIPAAGAEVLILVQVSSPESITSVSEIRLHDSTGQETLLTADAEEVTGRTEGLYTASLALPDKPFFVSIVGLDTQGWAFLRTQPSEIQVVEFKLEHVPGTDTIEDLVPGGEGNFTFQVTNTGPADDTMSISVSVSSGADSTTLRAAGPAVTASVEPASMVLATGENVEGVVTVSAPQDAQIGTTVKVTLTVQSASTSALNFLSTDATVFAAQNDTDENPYASDHTPPTCTVLGTEGGCTADQMSQDCHLHEWSMRFQATDDTIVIEIDPDPEIGSNQSLVYEKFGLDDVTAKYTAPCCCPKVSITVTDGAGNSASCNKDYYTPVSKLIDEPVCNGLHKIDRTPPTCTVLGTGGGCTADQMGQDCRLHEWWMRFQATDDTVVTEIALDPEIGSSQSLIYEKEDVNKTVAKYNAPCCCPMVKITLRDRAGNTASCGKDYYTPVSDQIEKPVCNGRIPVPEAGLSTGAIVGIAVGAVAVVVVLGAAVLYLLTNNGSGKTATSVSPIDLRPDDQQPVKYKGHLQDTAQHSRSQLTNL